MNLRKTDFVFSSLACSGNILRKQAKAGKTKSVFLQIIKNHWTERLAVKTTFFTLYLSNLNPEDEVFSSKIDWFMAYYISKLKWAWQAQFLSHILIILKNNVFFEDKQMILLPLFDIYTGFRFTKNLNSCSIQFWSHPWVSRVPPQRGQGMTPNTLLSSLKQMW